MRQPMVPVIDAVNAAFQYFVTAAELLCVLQYIFLRFKQTQFPLTVPHCGTRTNRKLDAAGGQLSCVNSCSYCSAKWNASKLPVFNQLLSIQLSSSDASSKIPKMIV